MAARGESSERFHRLYLALTSLTKEDFQQLLADSSKLKTFLENVIERGGGMSDAVFSTLMWRWAAVDPEIAAWAPKVMALIPPKRWPWIVVPLAKKQPEKTLTLLSATQSQEQRDDLIVRALSELRLQNPAKARAWLESCAEADRKAAEIAMLRGAVQEDPVSAVAQMERVKDQREASVLIDLAVTRAAAMGPGVLRQLASSSIPAWALPRFLFVFASREPEMAVDLVVQTGGKRDGPDASVTLAFDALARRDLAKAIAKVDELTGPNKGTALAAIARQWSNEDPAAALEWLAKQPADQRIDMTRATTNSRDSLISVFFDWANTSPNEARKWVDALPPGEMRKNLQMEMANTLAKRGDAAQAVAILAALGDAVDPKVLNQTAENWALRDPQAAADWAISQPSGSAQSRALAGVVGAWANDDPAATQQWLTQFPQGEVRDRCVAAFLMRRTSWMNSPAQQIAEFDQWFDVIDDPWQRALVAEQIYRVKKRTDPEGARTWLTSLPNVDPELTRLTLRQKR